MADRLEVIVSGGGPVGLSFALCLQDLMPNRVSIKIYDGRWRFGQGGHVVWKSEEDGNARRQQVVTIQSRQFLKLPQHVQAAVFAPGKWEVMWPTTSDAVNGVAPRNVRVAHFEDQLLSLCNSAQDIELHPRPFYAESEGEEIRAVHLFVIAEGAASTNRKYYSGYFGESDKSMYSLDGRHLSDVVLGLRVRSTLSPATAVLLTIAQNRFLLNSLNGEGFLNMRLSAEEVGEVRGFVDLDGKEQPVDCIQSSPCLMESTAAADQFRCKTHRTLFGPPLRNDSRLWPRIMDGLKLFGVRREDLTAVTAFRLELEQRPLFTTPIFERTSKHAGTYGCLIGDAANAIHFWPGRGLNTGLTSAFSLARCVSDVWDGSGFRDAHFMRHEAVMAMLQYRNKTRAWRAMVSTSASGKQIPIKELISQAITRGGAAGHKDSDVFLNTLRTMRSRLNRRLPNLPDDAALTTILAATAPDTLRVLIGSQPWDVAGSSGDEVEIDSFYGEIISTGAGGNEPPVGSITAPSVSVASPSPAEQTQLVESPVVTPESVKPTDSKTSAAKYIVLAIVVALIAAIAVAVWQHYQ